MIYYSCPDCGVKVSTYKNVMFDIDDTPHDCDDYQANGYSANNSEEN